jgi:hypothetical protein
VPDHFRDPNQSRFRGKLARGPYRYLQQASNTSFESINQLVSKTCSSLEAEVAEYKRQIAGAVKSPASSAKKADEAKKLSDSLAKRLSKLEEKVGKLD